jgi:hypothetical protein
MKNGHRRGGRKLHGFDVEIDGAIYGWARRTPVSGAAEQRWLEGVCRLVLEHSRFIHGEDMDSQLTDLALVGRAAEEVWAAAPGAPTWLALDVEGYLARLDEDFPGRELLHDTAFWGLISFVTWLGRTGRISVEDAVAIQERFIPFAATALRSVLPASVQAHVLH